MKHITNTLTKLSALTNWYVLIAILTIGAYPFTTKWLESQVSIYQIHVGNPASILVVYFLYGWLFDKWWKKKYGKKGIKGWSIFAAGIMVMTLALHFAGIKVLW